MQSKYEKSNEINPIKDNQDGLFDMISKGYADLYMKQLSSFNSFSSEYNTLVKQIIQNYLRDNVDHFLLNLNSKDPIDPQEIRKTYSKFATQISEKVRESIGEKNLSQFRNRERFSTQTWNHQSNQESKNKVKRYSEGQEFNIINLKKQHHNESMFKKNSKAKDSFINIQKIDCESQNSEHKLKSVSNFSQEIEGVLISKKKRDFKGSETVFLMEMADEYLVNLIDLHLKNCEKSVLISDTFYKNLVDEYIEQSKKKPESPPDNKIMKMGVFIDRVVKDWFELTLQSKDNLNFENIKPLNWKDEVSVITSSNNPLSRTMTAQQRISSSGQAIEKKRREKKNSIQTQNSKKSREIILREDSEKVILSSGKTPKTENWGSTEEEQVFRRFYQAECFNPNLNPSAEFEEEHLIKRSISTIEERKKQLQTGSKVQTQQSPIHFPQNVTFRENTNKPSSTTRKNTQSLSDHLASFISLQLNRKNKENSQSEMQEPKAQSTYFEKPQIFRVINTLKLQVLHERSKRKHAKQLDSIDGKSSISRLSINSEKFQTPQKIKVKSPLSNKQILTPRKVFDFKRAESFSQKRSTSNSGNKIDESNSSFYFFDLGLVGPDWIEYEGELKNGERHGFGKWVLGNNERFEGNFYEGKAHGKGRYVSRKGEVLVGFWIQNVFQKEMEHDIFLERETEQKDSVELEQKKRVSEK